MAPAAAFITHQREHHMTKHWRAMALLWSLTFSAACDGGQFCFPVTQDELNDALANAQCRTIRVHDFDAEHLEATTERDDVELSINPDYCVTFNQCQGEGPILKTAHIDNIPISAVNLESVVVTRYRSGVVRVPGIDLTLGDAPLLSRSVGFVVLDGGSVRLKASGPMDEWLQLAASAQPSWEGVTVEVDPSAQPTTRLGFSGEGLNLAQLQQFGAKAREVSVGLSTDVAEAYASWLESEGFTGTLTVAIDGESVVMLPRATNP